MKRLTRPAVYIPLFLIVGFVSGCAGLRNSQRLSEFQDTASLYRNAIRWSNFKGALAFLEHPSEALGEQGLKRLALVRVTDYEVTAEQASPDRRAVDVTAVIEYMWLDRMVQRRVIDHQHWVYVDRLKRWQIDGGLPQFN